MKILWAIVDGGGNVRHRSRLPAHSRGAAPTSISSATPAPANASRGPASPSKPSAPEGEFNPTTPAVTAGDDGHVLRREITDQASAGKGSRAARWQDADTIVVDTLWSP